MHSNVTPHKDVVSYPDPDFHSCADGLHHRYVKSGSGKVLYSFLSSDYIIRREECIMMPYMEWSVDYHPTHDL